MSLACFGRNAGDPLPPGRESLCIGWLVVGRGEGAQTVAAMVPVAARPAGVGPGHHR